MEEAEIGDDALDDLKIADNVPYESILLKCACGDSDCTARLGFARQENQLRLIPENWIDHFVVETTFMATVLMAVDEEAEEDTEPDAD